MAKYSGSDWDFEMIENIWEDIVKIAAKYDLDYYEPQIEIISSEQMLDNYSVTGMPVYYPHWSFGKRFENDKRGYVAGEKGLAFEIVINSNPSICYIMENNTLALQILVLAHAAVGHSAYFKNNYLFKAHTDADNIIDFLIYGRDYILDCEQKYGAKPVEQLLDSCHALSNFGMDKSLAPTFKSRAFLNALEDAKEKQDLSNVNELWDTLFEKRTKPKDTNYCEENILRFIRDNSNVLEDWERNIMTICMYINQYFYPQMQTQVGNEGFATFWHYTLMQDMYDADLIDDGIMLEFIANHNAVIRQTKAFRTASWGDYFVQNEYYGGINPYALGFAMYKDIRRICETPTEHDKEMMPHLIGQDWVTAIKDAAYNYNDSSFINQFLSPKVIDDFKLMSLEDDTTNPEYTIQNTSAESNYSEIRMALARQYDLELRMPQLHVGNKISNQVGNCPLVIVHTPTNDRKLHTKYTEKTLTHIRKIWGQSVQIVDKRLPKMEQLHKDFLDAHLFLIRALRDEGIDEAPYTAKYRKYRTNVLTYAHESLNMEAGLPTAMSRSALISLRSLIKKIGDLATEIILLTNKD